MENKSTLEKDILNITMKINMEFPELSKYIAEIPDINTGTNSNLMDVKSFKQYYFSLKNILDKYAKTHISMDEIKNKSDNSFPDYPQYKASDDIYNQGKNITNLDPEDISKNKTPNEEDGALNELDFEDDMSGDDLDVPGSELDDKEERTGSEDEENNYYSLGGDDHNDLEEDKN